MRRGPAGGGASRKGSSYRFLRGRARIPRGTGLAVAAFEGPEADQRNAVTLLHGDLRLLNQATEHLVDIRPRNRRLLLDRVDELLAIQGRLLALRGLLPA